MPADGRADGAAAGPPANPDITAHLERLLEASPAERDAALAELRSADPSLAREVERLLAADASADGYLEVPAAEHYGELLRDWYAAGPDPEAAGAVGPYRLLELLGRGGMGEVWLAARADGQFEQRVALKLLKRGMDSEAVVRRFRRERQILARLEHPNIARLLDGGVSADGRLYFVLERVDGMSITTWCAERGASIERRLRLVIDACRAVEAAHRNLVVHRDLKPSNILVDREGAVKLLDFGIAKVLQSDDEADESRLTRLDERVLTPAYAAPEQVRGEPVTTATDVYALGVVLYELLTGRLPHQRSHTSAHTLEQEVARETVERPSAAVRRGEGPPRELERRARRLSGDLDTIVLEALQREPERRYPSAAALADDLERHLAGLPVRARPDTFGYRWRKFAARHRWPLAAAAAILFLLVAGLAGTLTQAARARSAATRAGTEARRAERVQGFLIRLFEGSDPDRARGEEITARQLLEEGIQRIEGELAGEPEIQGALFDAISQIERRLGRLEEAEQLARRSLAVRRSAGTDPPAVDLARLTLGEALLARGELESARAELTAVLPALLARLGEDSEEVARARTALAGVQLHLADAPATLEQAAALLASSRRRWGDHHPETARSLKLYGHALELTDRYTDAEAAYRASVDALEQTLGTDHSATAGSRNALASVLARQGELTEAEREYRRALETQRRILGAHPDTGQTLISLGLNYITLRRFAEAEAALREALAIFEPLDHYETGTCLRLLGQVASSQGRWPEAAALFESALDRLRAKLGPRDQLTLTALGNLGGAHIKLGELERGRAEMVEALTGLESLLGPTNDVLRAPLLGLGEAERRLGNLDAALAAHRRGLAIAESTVGARHLGAASQRRELALDLLAAGTAESVLAARPMLDEAVAILTENDPEHPRLAEWQVDSARLAAAAGDRARAQRELEAAVARLAALYGEQDPRTRQARTELAALDR